MGKIINSKTLVLILHATALQTTALDTRVNIHATTFTLDYVN